MAAGVAILAATSPGEVQVAVVADGVLQDFALWRPGRPDGVGDLHRGRVVAHVPGMAGAFVSIGSEEGFLPDSEGGAGALSGAPITVRITRASQGGKGPRLTARVPQSEGPPGLLQRGPGPLEEFAATHPDAPVLVDDPALAATLRPVLGDRIRIARPAFDEGIAEQVDALFEPEAALPGGMRALFYPTPALVAIDLDMGAATSSRQAKPAAQLAANLAALPDLARQIRLRNLSGAILVDPAGLQAAKRKLLAPALEAALAADPLRPRLLGFTRLGLAELVRPRLRPPLHELYAGPHAAALLALRALVRQAEAAPHQRLRLRAAPALLAALAQDAVAAEDVARRTGAPLITSSDPTLALGAWHIETAT